MMYFWFIFGAIAIFIEVRGRIGILWPTGLAAITMGVLSYFDLIIPYHYLYGRGRYGVSWWYLNQLLLFTVINVCFEAILWRRRG